MVSFRGFICFHESTRLSQCVASQPSCGPPALQLLSLTSQMKPFQLH